MKGITKKFLLFALSGVLLLTVFMPLFPAGKAYAISPGQWVDQNTIIIGPATGKHATYTLDSSGNYVYSPSAPSSIISGSTTCSNTIYVSGVILPANSAGTILLQHWANINPDPAGIALWKCKPLNGGKAQPITLTDTANASLAPGSTTPSPGGLGCDLGIDISSLSSFIDSGLNALNPLNWILCGVIQASSGIVKGLDKAINDWLVIGTNGNTSTDNPGAIFSYNTPSGVQCSQQISGSTTTACDDYHSAWAAFEQLALGLLAIITLAIIIAQALGTEILDAYTIRKMLPRVVACAIILTISWPLMKFFVTVSNDLGYGIKSLLYHPFSGISDTISTGNLLTGLAAGIGILSLGFFGLLSFLGTAALAVLVAFLTLVFRQIAVILLIIFSPIAIMAYTLPNTQRVFKFWWESFSKMLLMFPMIIAMITIGHIFSQLASQAATSASGFTSATDNLIAVIAYFAPYFMIPFTFRFAGGIMSGVGGVINSRAEGARGALRTFRGNRLKQNAADFLAGERFKGTIPGTSRISDRLNKVGRGAGVGWQGRFGLGVRGREATAMAEQIAKDNALKDPKIQAIKGKNDFNRVSIEGIGKGAAEGRKGLIRHLTEDGGDDGKTFLSQEQAAARADVAVKAVMASGGFTVGRGAAALYNMARDGTAIRDTEDLARLAAKAGQGNANNTFTYAAESAALSKAAGRPGLSPATEDIGNLAFRQSDIIFNNKQPRLYNPAATGDEVKSDENLIIDSELSAIGNTQDYEWFTTSKGRDLRNSSATLTKVVANKDNKYSEAQRKKAATQMASRLKSIKYGTGADNKRIEAYEALVAPLPDDASGKSGIDYYNEYAASPAGTGETKIEQQQVRTYVQQDDGKTHREVIEETPVTRPVTNKDKLAEYGAGDIRQDLTEAQKEEQRRSGAGPEGEEQ